MSAGGAKGYDHRFMEGEYVNRERATHFRPSFCEITRGLFFLHAHTYERVCVRVCFVSAIILIASHGREGEGVV